MAVRVIYFYNLKTSEYAGSMLLMDASKQVPTDYTTDDGVMCGVTTVRPADGLYTPRHFDLDKQDWIGTPKEEWLAAHPAPTPVPTVEQTAEAQLMLQIAQNKTAQDSFNAQALLQIAELKGATANV